MTELPDVDVEAVAAFWERFVGTGQVAAGTPVPAAEPFGDSVELADELIALVVDGPKRATAGSFAAYEQDGVPIPAVGDLSIATDGAGRPRAVLRTTDVRIGPLDSVDEAFAWDEGEGDRTRASWLADHERYFRRSLAAAGLPYAPDLATVFQRFDVPYAE